MDEYVKGWVVWLIIVEWLINGWISPCTDGWMNTRVNG